MLNELCTPDGRLIDTSQHSTKLLSIFLLDIDWFSYFFCYWKKVQWELLVIFLLQIACRICQWKNFENRSVFSEDWKYGQEFGAMLFLCLRKCSGWRHYVSKVFVLASRTNSVSMISCVFVDGIWPNFHNQRPLGQGWMLQILGSKGQGSMSWWGQICPKCTFWPCSCHLLVEA